jgi:hypothetical protein
LSIDYLKKYLFIFFFLYKFETLYKLYRHNKRKIINKFEILYTEKSLNFKYINLLFRDLINIINFRIYPINSKIYYKKRNLLSFIIINKKNLENIY